MATLPMVLINQADIKSAGGVALRVRTQEPAKRGLKRIPSNLVLIGIVGVLLCGAVALIGFLLQRSSASAAVETAEQSASRANEITWSFDSPGPNYFLAMVATSPAAVVPVTPGQNPLSFMESVNKIDPSKAFVLGFQATGKNNLSEPMVNVSGSIRSDVTNETLPINFVVDATPVAPSETFGVPPQAQFTITTVNVPIADPARDGAPVSEFLTKFASFTFVFNYDGHNYTRHFSKDEVKHQFDLFSNMTRPDKSTEPRVVRKPKKTT